MSTKTYFYPDTAECLPILGNYPGYNSGPEFNNASYNSIGGYGGALDITDFNGSHGGANVLIVPDAVGSSVGISDLMPRFAPPGNIYPHPPWYLMRRTNFKNWAGVTGIFKRNMDFILEIDIEPKKIAAYGGFRSEAPNSALSYGGNLYANSPYKPGAQGNGLKIEAIVNDSVTNLEVVKDSRVFEGAIVTVATPGAAVLSFPRQTVQLSLTNITPSEMASIVLRITTEQYFSLYGNPGIGWCEPPDLETTIYRIGLAADPLAMRSSGKASAALTSR